MTVREIWKRHPVYIYYEVSTLGRVRSLDRVDSLGRLYKGRIKRTCLGSHGYFWTGITHEGKTRTINVAVLVAETFIGPRPSGQVLRHGPKGRLDDSLDNVCWGTQSQNCLDKVRDGTAQRGEKNGQAKLTRTAIQVIRASNETQQTLADRHGVGVSQINRIINHKSWKHL